MLTHLEAVAIFRFERLNRSTTALVYNAPAPFESLLQGDHFLCCLQASQKQETFTAMPQLTTLNGQRNSQTHAMLDAFQLSTQSGDHVKHFDTTVAFSLSSQQLGNL